MASTLRFGLGRPATTTTTTSHLAQQTHSLLSQLTTSSPNASASRLFSTTPLLLKRGLPRQGRPREADGTKSALAIPTMSSRDPQIPAYPCGERQVYKQSNRGLYGASRLQFGNNVSKKHNVKTPRKWRPNVTRRLLWSEALRCYVQTRVTARVLRTIDKSGGLDNYLLGDKQSRLRELGPWGWKLRWRVMQTDVVAERFRQERVRYGLAPLGVEDMIQREQASAAFSYGGPARAADPAGFSSADVDERLQADEDFVLGTEDGPVEMDDEPIMTHDGPIRTYEAPIGKDEGFMREEKY